MTTEYQARVYYSATGSSALFAVPFPYLLTSHIEVYVDGDLIPADDLTWTTTSSITLDATPAAASVVEIRRVTPEEEMLHEIQYGSIVPDDLNTNNLQLLYRIQEVADQSLFDLTDAAGIAGAVGATAGISLAFASVAAMKAYADDDTLTTTSLALLKTHDASADTRAAGGLFHILSSSPGSEDGGTRFTSTGAPGFYFNRISDRHQLHADWFGLKVGSSSGLAAGNDTALSNWLGELGNSKKKGFLPAGTIRFATDIVVPASRHVVGAGALNDGTLLVPTSGITSCAITQLSGSTLEDIAIDMTNANTKRGWEIGVEEVTSDVYKKVNNGLTRRVHVINASGSGGAGGWLARADAWRLENNVWWGDNKDGFIVGPQSLAAAYQDFIPTECSFVNEYYKQNDRYGLACYGGSLMRWYDGSMELNGEAGILVIDTYATSSDPMEDFHFNAVHIEQNWQSFGGDKRTKFDVVANVSSNDGRVRKFIFNRCRHVSPDNASYARPIQWTNIRGFTVIDPSYMVSNATYPAFSVNGTGDSGRLVEWSGDLADPADTGMFVDNTVDGGIQISGFERDLDISANMAITLAGDLALTSTNYKAKMYRRNRTVKVVGVMTFTPTYTGTPGPLIFTCSDLKTASNKTNAPANWNGTVTFDKINKTGTYTEFWCYIEKNASSIKFKGSSNNVAAAVVNIEDLPSGAACTITFELEYEIKLAGTVG